MKIKKRWLENTNRFWFIEETGPEMGFAQKRSFDQLLREFPFGIYQTKAKANAMMRKIKALVEKELGK